MPRRVSPVFRVAQRLAKRERLERRAALIGAGIEVAKAGKFHNAKTTYNGVAYDSLGEAEYAAKLDMLRKTGAIVDWERPKPVVVDDRCLTCGAVPGEPCRSPKTGKPMATYHQPRMVYTPDFYVVAAELSPGLGVLSPSPHGYYVDYKGSRITETPLWRRKVIQWRKNVPHELRVAYPDGTEKVVATGLECFGGRA